SAIRCYNCATGQDCTNEVDCGTQDSCLSVTTQDKKIYRRCINYNQCNAKEISLMFPSVGKFNSKCCTRNLCNSANTVTMAKPVLALGAAMLSICWRFI
uniref:MAC-inhibitory protein n=1 Tax=Echeneis naucrates TaxID=173247 RepID=A0A665VLV8_ECHNA